MQNLPEIYVLNALPSLGEMGAKTIVQSNIPCKTCNINTPSYPRFSYRFASWNGEDFISVMGIYNFVSERLKEKLEPEIKDELAFVLVGNEKADYFKMGKKAYRKTLPKFYRLDILKCLDGPDIWWKRVEVCADCGKQRWNITSEGIESTVSTSKIYHPRKVYANTWNNELIFKLHDPGLPIVTQKFLDIVNAVCIEKIELKKAMWV